MSRVLKSEWFSQEDKKNKDVVVVALLVREATGWGGKANEVQLFYMTNFKGREKRGIKLEREKGLNSKGYYKQYEKIRMWIMRRASLEVETKKTEQTSKYFHQEELHVGTGHTDNGGVESQARDGEEIRC